MTDIIIFVETETGTLHSTAGELIAAGRKLADTLGNEVCAVIMDKVLESEYETLIHLGADRVYITSHSEISKGNLDAFVSSLEQICIQKKPSVILTVIPRPKCWRKNSLQIRQWRSSRLYRCIDRQRFIKSNSNKACLWR